MIDSHPAPRRMRTTPERWSMTVGAFAAALMLVACSPAPASETAPDVGTSQGGEESSPAAATPREEPADDAPASEEPADAQQEESCDWDSPRITPPVEIPQGQDGVLSEVLVGAWQHTHTDDGSGFEEVVNDHRFVFPAPDRMLYCQHVPGATDHAENAADVTLDDTRIALPGGKYSYTVTAWDEDTMLWDNPVGNGYVYLLQRR